MQPHKSYSELSLLQWQMLEELGRASVPLRGAELARRVGVPGRTIGSRLVSLVKGGFVYECGGFKEFRWAPTPDGREALGWAKAAEVL